MVWGAPLGGTQVHSGYGFPVVYRCSIGFRLPVVACPPLRVRMRGPEVGAGEAYPMGIPLELYKYRMCPPPVSHQVSEGGHVTTA